MSALSLYFHTLRHLRFEQLVGRLWMRLYRPKVDLSPAPALRAVVGTFQPPIAPAPSLSARNVFSFLNVARTCATAQDWRPQGAEKLWIYNLHYFDDLNAVGAAERTPWHDELLNRWAVEVRPGQGDAWEPYPVSRRIVNWVKRSLRGPALPAQARNSLAAQARWLMKRLEYHLLGNHLFTNAKALIHAGLFFDGPEAQRWLSKGLAIVQRELHEQVLSDGGHFELSPMYHAAMIEDMLDLVNVQQAYGVTAPAAWLDAIDRMRRWLAVMCHPDGDISFFNDSALGIAPSQEILNTYAASLELPAPAASAKTLEVLRSSGYVRWRNEVAYLICDCGAVGPAYLPGHAHADSLSFELSLYGQRVLVNSGTSRYGLSEERHRQRGTAAHNTVTVAGANSSEVWAGFRVARRATVTLHQADETVIDASHDGYRRLPGANIHRRRWWLQSSGLRIQDIVSGGHVNSCALFHLHPDVEATRASSSEVLLKRGAAVLARIRFEGSTSIEVRAGAWHPGFGVAIPNQCVLAAFESELVTYVDWTA